MLIMVEGSLISFGIMISYWVDFALYWAAPNDYDDPSMYTNLMTVSWRFPIAFQIILVIPTFVTIWLPESPRWLMLKDREPPAVEEHIAEIKEGLDISSRVRLRDLFRQGKSRNFQRTMLAFVIQMFQQISGINLITYYAGTVFENSIGLTPVQSRILAACNGTEYFLASIFAIFTIEKWGRRPLMIWTALGMSFTMAVLCAVLSRQALGMPPGPYDPGRKTKDGPPIAAAVMLFVFNSFFAVGWLGMTWLYPAECTPLSIRAQANGLSTSSNWLFNFMVVMISPVAFATINNYTYLIFAVINFLMVPTCWWIFPETAGRSLEEMDLIFAQSNPWNPHDVVRKERKFPRRYDKKGNITDHHSTHDVAAIEDYDP
ncbi:hypothetical protein MSPP1_002339 [Malassezia sp. CBS 17886]|nr:hypothetical protein MSPP1_002339 [Malassezia sp. CBS 17886]